MVQTFGKRVLGGIGAPGGGMSTAYGEGVTTSINQRIGRQGMAETAQAMQMRDQEMAWATEDREEAKRQRAAAAAAAASARARSAALAKALAGGVGARPAPGLNIPPGQTFGPRVAVGGPTPTLPPATGAPVPPRPPLSFESPNRVRRAPIDVAPTTGLRISEAPMNISNIEFVKGTYDTAAGAPAFERGGRGGLRVQYPEIPPEVDPAYFVRMMGESRPLNEILQERVLTPAEARAEIERMRIAAETPVAAPAVPTPTAPTAPTTMQGPPVAPAVTIQGPNGPIVVPTEEAYPTGTVYGTEPAQLSFGPALGAANAAQTATAVDRVAANPVGQAQPVPNAELYIMEPGRPGRELQQTYDAREELVRQLDIYAEYGDYAAVRDLTTKINELDNSLYYLQGMQGIQELQFNSPQRLQMVLSEELGRDIGLQPNAQGGYDVYVDGMLALQKDAGGGENSISYWARSILDDTFGAAEAARAEEYNMKRFESGLKREETLVQGEVNIELARQKEAFARESARIAGLTELDLMAIKRDLGLTNDDTVQFQKDEGSGMVLVFRNGELEAQYGPSESMGPSGETVQRYELK